MTSFVFFVFFFFLSVSLFYFPPSFLFFLVIPFSSSHFGSFFAHCIMCGSASPSLRFSLHSSEMSSRIVVCFCQCAGPHCARISVTLVRALLLISGRQKTHLKFFTAVIVRCAKHGSFGYCSLGRAAWPHPSYNCNNVRKLHCLQFSSIRDCIWRSVTRVVCSSRCMYLVESVSSIEVGS